MKVMTEKNTTTSRDRDDGENDEHEAECSSVASFGQRHDNDESASFGTDLNDDSNHHSQHANKRRSTNPAEEAQERIAQKETFKVKGLKILVLAVLIISMVTVTVGVYMFTTNAEQKDFEDSVSDYTVKIFASLGENIDLTLGATDAFAVSLVSHAKSTNQTWPFVTIPDFAVRGAKIRSLSSATILLMYQYVAPDQRAEWEAYSAQHGPQWVHESIAIQERDPKYHGPIIWDYENWNVLHRDDEYDKEFPGINGTDQEGPYLPMWQSVPVIPRYPAYNWDLFTSDNGPNSTVRFILKHKQVVLSKPYLIYIPGDNATNESNELEADWYSDYIPPGEEPMEPISDIYYPILSNAVDDVSIQTNNETGNNNNTSGDIVAFLTLAVYWRDTLKNILPNGANGVDVVFDNPCSPSFTYRINGPAVAYRGSGDLHETQYTHLGTTMRLQDLGDQALSTGRSYSGLPVSSDYHCSFALTVYPSSVLQDYYITSTPMLFTIAAVVIFLFTSAVFLFYDIMVEKRQKLVLSTAAKSSAIVASLFPSNVRAELMKEQEERAERERTALLDNKRRLSSFLTDDDHRDPTTLRKGSVGGAVTTTTAQTYTSKPLAELYAETTVFFGDIAGFTAWSSARDPCQVFTLLETLYGAFDAVARKRGVFKVETIGDSYVAVCGLPQPRKNHAVVMAKFAAECRNRTNQICRELEITLGPGTADLKFRIGLHSGPVTAGVLRGDKSRFQLFGDTVNTAARMESNSIKNKIQVSQKTADLLVAAGKGHWLTARDTLVDAKGKGKMQTYWLEPQMSSARSESDYGTDLNMSQPDIEDLERITNSGQVFQQESAEQYKRLVEWNTAMFEELLKQVVFYHQTPTSGGVLKSLDKVVKKTLNTVNPMAMIHNSDSSSRVTVRDEVVEILNLPEFESKRPTPSSLNLNDVELSDIVKSQLHSFILAIANTYRQNPFHNFEHASHVAMATKKLLQRVVTPEFSNDSFQKKDLHDYTYGITSDPLTQFALATAALIHDIDHQGVTNGQLVKEEAPVAIAYKNKSVAEQNSFDIAWNLFMDPCYTELRNSICTSSDELKRFRQIVLNSVMATDIFDKDLKALRDSRWEKAFQQADDSASSSSFEKDDAVCTNRKATIVIEHIIQASDVSHCMQHWTVYQKWNRCLFREMYSAYLAGRGGENDPSQGWYKGELWFFDNYIIPLAHRLKECGVFGASYAELLDFARDNRLEWENKGQTIVAEMVEKFNQIEKSKSNVGMLGAMVGKKESDVSCTEPMVPVEKASSGSIFVSV